MNFALTVRNRQRVRRVDARQFKKILTAALTELGVEKCELCFHLVGVKEMAKVNWDFLRHEGSTDVITFDLAEGGRRKAKGKNVLHGEIFICLDDAVKQAREFGTSWPSELVRYAGHGILHLLGHDDLLPVPRKQMKREENRLVCQLARQFRFASLAR
ncbi:MAG: rRNA maturation RNase YbeY [Verrucomicrobiota bacterium]|jgi:probable rRNA maturation factor